MKLDIFRRLDARAVTRSSTSNTSSIPIMKIAMADPAGSVIGVHFFNPVPVLKLVEIVPSLLTIRSDRTVRDRLRHRVHSAKTTIRSQDRAGFIVNSLLVPYILAAIRMVRLGRSPRPRTSTTGWCWAAPTRWARFASPT